MEGADPQSLTPSQPSHDTPLIPSPALTTTIPHVDSAPLDHQNEPAPDVEHVTQEIIVHTGDMETVEQGPAEPPPPSAQDTNVK